jgi:hypothetical protein
MFKTSPFTLKWRPNHSRPASGAYNNDSYRNSSFNVVNVNPPSWPPRDIWNNVWYNNDADFRTGFFYDVYSSYSGAVPVGNFYDVLTYAGAYVYYAPEYGCCWCECGGGGGTITTGVWADGYFNFATWGTWGECRSCRNNHWSTRYWYRYQTYRYYNVYTRYNYTDHSQPLSSMTIFKDYSASDGLHSTRRVD